MSAEQAIATVNITAEEFRWYDVCCHLFEWFAQGDTNRKGYDIVQDVYDFMSEAESRNVTGQDAWMELGTHLGTTPERSAYTYEFFGPDYPFYPSQAETLLAVMSQTGSPTANSGLVAGIFGLLAFVIIAAVGLRLYARIKINGFIRMFDWVLIAGVVTTFAYGIMNSITISTTSHYRLFCDRTWHDYVVETGVSVGTFVLYPVSVILIKSSLLLFYWGLTTWWPLRAATIVTFVLVLGANIGYIFGTVFKCAPVLTYEGFDFFTQECDYNQWEIVEYVCGSFNIATDIIIWLIPLPMVWKITQSMRERILSFLTFGVGALACIACGFRFSSARGVFEVSTTPTLVPTDQATFLLWTIVELCLGIICSCTPAIRALVLKKKPSILGSAVTSGPSEDTSNQDEKSVKAEKHNPTTNISSIPPSTPSDEQSNV